MADPAVQAALLQAIAALAGTAVTGLFGLITAMVIARLKDPTRRNTGRDQTLILRVEAAPNQGMRVDLPDGTVIQVPPIPTRPLAELGTLHTGATEHDEASHEP